MANDRIFLRCDKCGDADLLLLYTTMGAGLDVYGHQPTRYQSWLEKHKGHHPDPYGDCKGIPGFSVTTESTTDEHVFETVPCDHPQMVKLPKESRKSATNEVKVTQCTTCGQKVTFHKQLVARELIR